ncbi:beta-galactosidase [Mycobacterium sp. AMU20-3851]|uniref:beta-galactosidase n=1 Tax=Mycobacterium sp. AMU20-3851 TaxID=3122055 RepID=UPI0037540820
MRRRLGRFLGRAAVLVALVLSMVATGPATAHAVVAPADGYGFAQGYTWATGDRNDVRREIAAVSRTGASWVRLPLDWSVVQPHSGRYDWGYFDNLVKTADRHGLRVLGLIYNTPLWARGEGPRLLFPSAPPHNPADLAAFAAAAAKRYAGRINAWEIWNEPNLPLFMGFVEDKAVRFTEMLRAVHPAIKSANPKATVVAAGLSPLGGDDSPPGFLAQMYAAGAQGFFDAAAAHPYVFPGGLAADSNNGWSDVLRMNEVMVANGDAGKKIWLTEMGASTNDTPEGVSQQEQARQIVDVLGAAAAVGWTGPAFIHAVRDLDTANRDDREANFGALLTTDWQPKYAATVLAR